MEKCRVCDKEVRTQCQKGTGFCGCLCEKKAQEKKLIVVAEAI